MNHPRTAALAVLLLTAAPALGRGVPQGRPRRAVD
jgi:hypothetical protein